MNDELRIAKTPIRGAKPGSGHSSFSRVRAFTLIELVTVMAIVSLFGVVIAGTVLSGTNQIRNRGAAARLMGDIRYVQRMALASSWRTWIVFNQAGNNYQLYVENAANPGKANRIAVTHPLDQSTGPTQFGAAAFTGVSIVSVNINSTNEVEFDGFGAPYDGNSAALTAGGTVTLSSGVAVTIQPVSGFVGRSG